MCLFLIGILFLFRAVFLFVLVLGKYFLLLIFTFILFEVVLSCVGGWLFGGLHFGLLYLFSKC